MIVAYRWLQVHPRARYSRCHWTVTGRRSSSGSREQGGALWDPSRDREEPTKEKLHKPTLFASSLIFFLCFLYYFGWRFDNIAHKASWQLAWKLYYVFVFKSVSYNMAKNVEKILMCKCSCIYKCSTRNFESTLKIYYILFNLTYKIKRFEEEEEKQKQGKEIIWCKTRINISDSTLFVG